MMPRGSLVKIAMVALATALATLNQTDALARGGGGGGGGGGGARGGGHAIGTSAAHQGTTRAAGVHTGGYAIGTGTSGATTKAAAVHQGGYAIGSQSSGQYRTNQINKRAGRYRRNGYYGGYYGYPLTGAGQVPTNPNVALPWNTDSEPDTTNHSNLHQAGPSMSFKSAVKSKNDPAFADFDAVANGRTPSILRGAPMTGPAPGGFNNNSADGFATPTGGFPAANASKAVSGRLNAVQKMLSEYKATGKLGTFDEEDFNKRLGLIRQQQSSVATASPAEQAAKDASIMKDLTDLEADIRSHQ